MRLETFSIYKKMPPMRLSDCTVIVVDVLRASSCIITAIENEAAKVIPAADAGSAAAIAGKLGTSECLLAGERGCKKLPGFDLGNSPSEYSRAAVRRKNVVISTTNGTAAISAVQEARHILIGGLINRTAVARKALSYGDDIVIVCAGTEGMESADDICAAGGIAEAIGREADEPVAASDMTLISTMMFSDWQAGRADLACTYHCGRLLRMGFSADVQYCLQLDVTEVVPEYRNGVIMGQQ